MPCYADIFSTGVMLFHNGGFYPNNTILNIDDVEEDTLALMCFTNNPTCCGDKSNRQGEWYLPNSTIVGRSNGTGNPSVYRNRGPSVLRLHKRSPAMAGLYHCEIPDGSGQNQSIYVGLYPASQGRSPYLIEYT